MYIHILIIWSLQLSKLLSVYKDCVFFSKLAVLMYQTTQRHTKNAVTYSRDNRKTLQICT
jgi:hypothetical protein